MIDPKLFSVDEILEALLYDMFGNIDAWRKHAEIVVGYMPPYPRRETKPATVVRYGNSFLRCEGAYFWDMYGNDFVRPARALAALLRAPVPPCAIRRFDGLPFGAPGGSM